MKRGLRYATCASVSLLALVATQSAFAQQLEEITVTARKVEENLMQVPLSISAVTAESIESAGIKDARELAAFTPGLFISYGVTTAASSRNLFFRGNSVDQGLSFIDGAPYAGQANPDLSSLERVEVLVGPQSAYFGRSTFTGAINYVTKDPSNEGFKGRVTAEVASYNSNNESISLEGPIVVDKLDFRITANHSYRGGQWTNGSDTSEKLGSAQKDSVTGIFVVTPNDKLRIKGLLEWSLDEYGPNASAALSGWGTSPSAQGVAPYVSRQLNCNLGGTFGAYWCGALPSAKGLASMDEPGKAKIISANNVVTPQIRRIMLDNALNLEPLLFDAHWLEKFGAKLLTTVAHLQVNYKTESGWTFNSNTALHRTKYQGLFAVDYRDATYVPNPFAVSGVTHLGGFGAVGSTAVLPTTSNTPSVAIPGYPGMNFFGWRFLGQTLTYDGSQEFRVTSPQEKRLRGSAGVNFFSRVSPGTVNFGMEPIAAGYGVAGNLTRNVAATPAIFGGVYYDFTDQLTVSAEGRYQWDSIRAQTNFIQGNNTPQPHLQNTFKSFSPRVSVDYKLTQDHMVYALWSVGYSPGGFNTGLIGQTAAIAGQLAALGTQLTFQQEKLENYEAGLKSTWLNGMARTTVDVYFQNWKNGQVANSQAVINAAGANTFVTVTQNVGLTKMSGVEFTGAIAVTENLTITGNYNYVHSNIRQYVYFPVGGRISAACAPQNGATCAVGKLFPQIPTGSTFAITPTFTAPLAGDWEYYVRGDWKHRGKVYMDFANVAWIPSSDTVDLHIGVKKENLGIEVYVSNLTNQQEFNNGEVSIDPSSANPGNTSEIRINLPQKRMFGLRANYSF